MTAVQTLQPKARRLTDVPPPEPSVETDEPETALDRYRRWCRSCDERRKQRGTQYEESPPTMEEIVAIVKEVRAEMYAEEQEQKNANCR